MFGRTAPPVFSTLVLELLSVVAAGCAAVITMKTSDEELLDTAAMLDIVLDDDSVADQTKGATEVVETDVVMDEDVVDTEDVVSGVGRPAMNVMEGEDEVVGTTTSTMPRDNTSISAFKS